MNKMVKTMLSILCLVGGVALLWFDYSFIIFGEKKTFGQTYIFAEPIKVLYVAIALLILGFFGLIFRSKR